jgi:serine/threonine protein kinase
MNNLRIAVPQVPKSNATQYTVTEAYYMAILDHVNIVAHHETFVHDGQLIVAMELCEVRRPRSRLSPPPRVRSLCPLVLSTYPVTPKTTHVHGGRGCGWFPQFGNLQSIIDKMRSRQAFFPVEVVVAVLLDLASGLAWMHRNLLAHRDIKPDNAFISASGVVKVPDFPAPPSRCSPHRLSRGDGRGAEVTDEQW